MIELLFRADGYRTIADLLQIFTPSSLDETNKIVEEFRTLWKLRSVQLFPRGSRACGANRRQPVDQQQHADPGQQQAEPGRVG